MDRRNSQRLVLISSWLFSLPLGFRTGPGLDHSAQVGPLFLANRGAGALLLGLAAIPLFAQTSASQTESPDKRIFRSTAEQDRQPSSVQPSPPQSDSGKDITQPTEVAAPMATNPLNANSQTAGKQPKRILWVIPNYRAVSANTQLPPLSPKGKLRLATQDSFDYSSFLLAGILAGLSQARNSTPEFQHGAAAYGRYYWHSFADQALGNYLTEAVLPIATRQDPRYYTLGPGNGNFGHRTLYALSRLVVTRTDSGGRTFNFSEVAGNAAGAAISNLYYPRQERTLSKTGQKWLLQLGIDAVFDVAKEFWPDINHHVFHDHYGSP